MLRRPPLRAGEAGGSEADGREAGDEGDGQGAVSQGPQEQGAARFPSPRRVALHRPLPQLFSNRGKPQSVVTDWG